jgi:hypothetical protein
MLLASWYELSVLSPSKCVRVFIIKVVNEESVEVYLIVLGFKSDKLEAIIQTELIK